jgi:plasmid stabilization system protein ParE
MSRPVRLTPRAVEEGLAAREWYEAERAGLGNAFGYAIEQVLELISEHPESSPKFYREFRRCRLSKFPYHLYYVPEQGEIIVVAILHAARSPQRVRRRLRE